MYRRAKAKSIQKLTFADIIMILLTSFWDQMGLPKLLTSRASQYTGWQIGECVYFPTAVAQYDLGAYDVWLLKGDREAYNAFLRCADWLLNDQDKMGGWLVWSRIRMTQRCPYSAWPRVRVPLCFIEPD